MKDPNFEAPITKDTDEISVNLVDSREDAIAKLKEIQEVQKAEIGLKAMADFDWRAREEKESRQRTRMETIRIVYGYAERRTADYTAEQVVKDAKVLEKFVYGDETS